MKNKTDLETYGKEKKEGLVKRIWNKTRFAREKKKREEREKYLAELRDEVKEEVKEDVKKEIKEEVKKREIDRILGRNQPEGKGKQILKKLAREFEGVGKNVDVEKVLGRKEGRGVLSNEKISQMLGRKSDVQPAKGKKKQQKEEDFSDKVRKIIG